MEGEVDLIATGTERIKCLRRTAALTQNGRITLAARGMRGMSQFAQPHGHRAHMGFLHWEGEGGWASPPGIQPWHMQEEPGGHVAVERRSQFLWGHSNSSEFASPGY